MIEALLGGRKTWPRGALRGTGPIDEVDLPGELPAVLAVHGFGATPNEVLMLTEEAGALGLRARAPLLPGHGTHARELAATRYDDWYARAEAELLALSANAPAIVGGQSMGAVIALDLATRHPDRVKALLILANAVRLRSPFPNLALGLASRLGLPDFALPKFKGPNIRDESLKGTHVTYDSQPMKAAATLRAAGLRVLSQLSKVHCPTLIAHGLYDRTCPPSNAWEVAQGIATPDVQLVLLPNSAHIVTKDGDRTELRVRVRTFLRRFAPAQGIGRS